MNDGLLEVMIIIFKNILQVVNVGVRMFGLVIF